MRRSSILVACGLLAAGLMTCPGCSPGAGSASRAPAPRRPGVLPDAVGRIELVVCKLDSIRRQALGNARLVTEIVSALPSRVSVVLLTNDLPAFTITPEEAPARVRLIELPEETSTTIWPQDPFLVLDDGRGGVRLLASKEFTRADDRVLAEHLARHLGVEVDRSALIFEGGNIVATDQHVFVGGDTITVNTESLGETPAQVADRFRAELGRDVIVVGAAGQSVGHIDMILTPLGAGRLLLADAAWGARIAEESLRAMPADVDAFERQCERMYFGHPAIKEIRGAGGEVYRPPPVIGETKGAIAASRVIAPELDELAASLTGHGYTVERVPLLFSSVRRREGATADAVPSREGAEPVVSYEPGYPLLTYNNVLLDTFGERTVFLPRYGFRALDAAALEVWKSLGWRVEPVRGLTVSAMHRGSLRCCVKVLKRVEEDPGTREREATEPLRRFLITDAALHTQIGLALFSENRLADAAREFRLAVKLYPGEATAHAGLAEVLGREGDLAAATDHLQKALAEEPQSVDLLLRLAQVLYLRGQIEGAIRHYLMALEIKPDDARVHVGLGSVYRERGDVRKALEHFERAAEIEPENEAARDGLRGALDERR